MTANHDDLQRSLGRVEGNQGAMEARMDRFEKLVSEGFDKVETTLEDFRKDVNARLTELESKGNEHKGARATLIAVGVALWSAVTLLAGHFWK